MRLLFGFPSQRPGFEFADLFSITFIWIVPIVIGIIPMIFATKEQLASGFYRISRPVLMVFLFFIIAFWTGKEDMICMQAFQLLT